MGNLCSIFHKRFKHLVHIVGCPKKAQLLDYILLSWQTSKYRLKNSDKKWFMKPYNEIHDDTGIARSTLERYIKDLDDAGLIERRQALCTRRKDNTSDSYEVKKRCYINITDKLLVLLNQKASEQTKPSSTKNNEAVNKQEEINNNHPSVPVEKLKTTPERQKIKQNEGTGHLISRGSIYISDHYSIVNNIVNPGNDLVDVDNPDELRRLKKFETMKSFVETEIKEEISDEVKQLVLGTFFNLFFLHKKEFSSPEQLISEYLFMLLNKEFYMPDISCIKHRNNILSKVLRENAWKTPRGFYKYFYLGQRFKDKKELKEAKIAQEKQQEGVALESSSVTHDNFYVQKDSPPKSNKNRELIKTTKDKLDRIGLEIHQEGAYLQKIELEYKLGDSSITEVIIEKTALHLNKLYKEQAALEETLMSLDEEYDLCA